MILSKTRDFGERISDTIQYIRQHLKDLLMLYLVFVVPFSLVAVLLGSNAFGGFFSAISNPAFRSDPFRFISPSFGVTILCYIMSGVAYVTVVSLHMRSQEENPTGGPYFNLVASRFLPKFLSNLLHAVLAFMALLFTALLIIIPVFGIVLFFVAVFYAMVAFAMVLPGNTIEDNAFPRSFQRAFSLIRDNFWSSLGFMFVVGMIFYFFSMVISMVALAIFGIASINFLKPDNTQITSRYFLVSGIAGVVSQVFYLLVHVGIGILFYSLREQKEGGGLEARLDQLGGSDPKRPEEQF
jgi:hypothetical protein